MVITYLQETLIIHLILQECRMMGFHTLVILLNHGGNLTSLTCQLWGGYPYILREVPEDRLIVVLPLGGLMVLVILGDLVTFPLMALEGLVALLLVVPEALEVYLLAALEGLVVHLLLILVVLVVLEALVVLLLEALVVLTVLIPEINPL